MPRLALLSWSGLLVLGSGCVYLRAPETPMPTVFHASASGDAAHLIVLLPGLADGPEDFADNGFVDAIRRANPRFDVVATDAHFGYYRTRTLGERLYADVLEPAAARYDEIWLVGISLGGIGGAIYAQEHPGAIDGLILLAPYMGDDDIARDVAAAGGLASWTPPPLESIEGEDRRKFHEVWRFYRGYVTDPANMPRLYLGYGEQDDFAPAIGLVAAALPPEQVQTRAGGHRWSVWRPVFEALVQRALPGR